MKVLPKCASRWQHALKLSATKRATCTHHKRALLDGHELGCCAAATASLLCS